MPATPEIQWVKIQGTFHVQVIPGATSTRCNKKIPAKAERSSVAMATHCRKCRLHWRDAVKTAKAEAAQLQAEPATPASGPQLTPKGVATLYGWTPSDIAKIVDAPMIADWLANDPTLLHAVSINVAAKLGVPEPIWWETGPLPEAPSDMRAALAVRWISGGVERAGEATPEATIQNDGYGWWLADGTRPNDGFTGWAWFRGKPDVDGGA